MILETVWYEIELYLLNKKNIESLFLFIYSCFAGAQAIAVAQAQASASVYFSI